MAGFFARCALLFAAVLIIGCRKEQQPEPNREPKSFYGKSIDQAKKVTKAVSAHDDATRHRAKELEDE